MNAHTKDIADLVAKAKALSGNRIKNKGRPRNLMQASLAKTVGAMRKQGCSISSIHEVLTQEKMMPYDKLQKFQFAYNQYKLHS